MLHKNSIVFCSLSLILSTVEADQWAFNAAYQFETGKFSESSKTDITTIPLSVSYFSNNWRYGIEVPYLHISGSSAIVPSGSGQSGGYGHGPGHGKISTGSVCTESITRTGMGDITLSVPPAGTIVHLNQAINITSDSTHDPRKIS